MTIHQSGLFVQPEYNLHTCQTLIWVTPAGFEKFMAKVGKAANGQIIPSAPLSAEDLNKILSTAPKYGIEIIPLPSIAVATSDGAKASQEAPPESVFERSSVS